MLLKLLSLLALSLMRGGPAQESEGEDAQASRVELEAEGGRGRPAVARQSRVKLYEVGPRLELEVVKVEEGVCSGRVLYHRYETRSKEQADAQQAKISEREALRAQRRKQQVGRGGANEVEKGVCTVEAATVNAINNVTRWRDLVWCRNAGGERAEEGCDQETEGA